MISFNLLIINSFSIFFVNIPLKSRDFKALTCVSVSFSKAFPKGEYANLGCSIILLYYLMLDCSLRYSYLSILPNDNADIFAVFFVNIVL